jgi:hypothetical protein
MFRYGERMQIRIRKSRRFEPCSHALGGQRATASRERGVGLNELLVDGAELRLALCGLRTRGGPRREHACAGDGHSEGRCGHGGVKLDKLVHPFISLVGVVAFALAARP